MLWANTSAGLPVCSITLAIVKVFPVPVAPKRVWNSFPLFTPLTNFLIALRKEDSVNNLNENFPFDYELIDGDKLDLSSTSLRNKLKDNLFNEEEISLKIIQYIKKNSLY